MFNTCSAVEGTFKIPADTVGQDGDCVSKAQ